MSGQTRAVHEAEALRRDIRAAYERLRERGELRGSVHGVSVDRDVDAHLPRGMELDRAEQLLRSAGFALAPMTAAEENLYASSTAILPNTVFGVRNEVVIVLTLRKMNGTAEIAAVDARILVTTL